MERRGRVAKRPSKRTNGTIHEFVARKIEGKKRLSAVKPLFNAEGAEKFLAAGNQRSDELEG